METTVFSTYVLPAVLAIIMFNLGLGLRREDFSRIYHNPASFYVGLFSQMVVLPLLAFTIAGMAPLRPELKVGIVIIAACPGGAVSNLITYYLRGNVPLSISLTAVNSFLILITIPVIIHLALNLFMAQSMYINLPITHTISRVFFMIIIPVIAGMSVRARAPAKADRIEKTLRYYILFLLAIVFSFVIFEKDGDQPISMDTIISIIPYVLTLNLGGMFMGLALAKLFRFDLKKRITLSVEVGIQNSALAITIAGSGAFLGSHTMAIPAVIYGMFTFFNAVIFGAVLRKWYSPAR